MTDILPQWRDACAEHGFKTYGYGTWFYMDANPNAAVNHGRALRGGRRSLIEFWQKQQEAGVSHVMLNVKPTRRTTKEIFEELGTHVLPLFPAQAERAQVGRP